MTLECVKCGHQNAEGQEQCQVCGLVLASIESADDGRTHPVYDSYIRIRKQCEGVATGTLGMDEFKRFLDEMSFKMAQKEQEIREVDIPPDLAESLREELEVGFEGIELYNRAMFTLREFVGTKSPQTLKDALELAWAGNEKINEARRINRMNRAAMGEEALAAEEPAET